MPESSHRLKMHPVSACIPSPQSHTHHYPLHTFSPRVKYNICYVCMHASTYNSRRLYQEQLAELQYLAPASSLGGLCQCGLFLTSVWCDMQAHVRCVFTQILFILKKEVSGERVEIEDYLHDSCVIIETPNSGPWTTSCM